MNKYSKIKNLYKEEYFKNVAPIIQKFENERIHRLYFSNIICAIAFSISFYLICLDLFYIHSDKGVLVKLGILVIGIALSIRCYLEKSLENKVKVEIMPLVCRCFGNIRWEIGNAHDEGMYKKSNLMPAFNPGGSYDDSFYGKYNGVEIEIQEPEFDIGYGRNRRTVFDGVIIKFKMNKKFKGNTVIRKDTFFHKTPAKNLVHTVLEDVDFETRFDVFTTDEIEARYLITPSFMERLKNMAISFESNIFSVAFYNEYLFIALSTGQDLFSMCSLTRPMNDIEQYAKMCEEILSIIKLIDYFKLNEQTRI